MQEPNNQFQIDGMVEQFDAATNEAVVKVITRRRSGQYENLLVLHIDDELAAEVKIGKMQSFVGRICRGADQTEPTLEVDDIDDAEVFFNLGKALIKLAQVEFFKAQPKRNLAQFASLYGDEVDGENTISAVAFRGLSQRVKSLAEGSILLLGGELRRKAFSDNSGRYSTDIILDPVYTEVVEEAAPKTIRTVKARAKVETKTEANAAKKSKKSKAV